MSTGGAEGEDEADSLLSREPDVGLDPGTPGLWDHDLSHPGPLNSLIFFRIYLFILREREHEWEEQRENLKRTPH